MSEQRYPICPECHGNLTNSVELLECPGCGLKFDVTRLAYYMSLPYTLAMVKDEGGDWVVLVVELDGCIAHGRSQMEALASIEEMKKLWFASALEAGSPIRDPMTEDEWVSYFRRRNGAMKR